jgi:hypothetical protein
MRSGGRADGQAWHMVVRLGTRLNVWPLRVRLGIDPFQNLLASALLDCFREKTRSISNARAPSARATAEFRKGCISDGLAYRSDDD